MDACRDHSPAGDERDGRRACASSSDAIQAGPRAGAPAWLRGLTLALAIGAPAAPAVAAAAVPGAAEQMLEATNRLRSQAGLPLLTADGRLAQAALAFARYMAQTDRYGHQADGREPAQRVEAVGYDWCMVAENIAWQYHSRGFDAATLARRTVEGWARSPPHRSNMLDPRARQIGIATAQSPRSGRHYAVQLFARPCGAGP